MTSDEEIKRLEAKNAAWEEGLQEVPIWRANQQKWPKGVRPVSLEELGVIGVDRAGRLYWDGKPIEIRSVVLGRWERFFAGATVAAAVTAAAVSAWSWGCDLEWVGEDWCPPKSIDQNVDT